MPRPTHLPCPWVVYRRPFLGAGCGRPGVTAVDYRTGDVFQPPARESADAPDQGWLWSGIGCDRATGDVVVTGPGNAIYLM